MISCHMHSNRLLHTYPVVASFTLQKALLYSLGSSLPHSIHHQRPDCWLEATLQVIASGLLQEQCHNNGGLLSSDPPGLVSVFLLGWKRRVNLVTEFGL